MDQYAPDPDLTDDEAVELLLFLDGQLDAERAAAVQARLDADPALAASVDRRRRAVDVIGAAVAETHAPFDLRMRIDQMATAGQAPRIARPKRRWLPFGALAGAAAAVIVAVVVATGGGGLSVANTVEAALRPPVATASVAPGQSALLREKVETVSFPNFAKKFAFTAIGTRTDTLDGRRTRTVFYEQDGKRIAYTIVAGDALDEPGEGTTTTVDGVKLRTLRVKGRTVVTWRRQGHTCVLSADGVDAGTLRTLAAWKGQGAVKF